MSQRHANISHSVRSRLLNVAKRDGLFFQTILTRYFHERLLYRMAHSRYACNFYLKGGSLIYALSGVAARPTLDIDFLGVNISNSQQIIQDVFKAICSVDCCDDGVSFNSSEIKSTTITEFKDYKGVRLFIPVQMDSIKQILTIDIGFGDVVTPGPIQLSYPLVLDTLPNISVLAYSIETLIAEKLHSVIELGDRNSRMKDYYDLFTILNIFDLNVSVLQEAINNTFKSRHLTFNESTPFYQAGFANNPRLIALWNVFVRKMVIKDVPLFNEVVEYIQKRTENLWKEYGLCTKLLQ